MKIKEIDIGKHRWLMFAYFDNWPEFIEFENWMKENYPGCMCKFKDSYLNGRHYEIRGGDMNIPLMIKLRWM